MKLYIFQAGDEFIKLKLDKSNEKCEIATSRTNYRFIPQPFWKLFGDSKKTMLGLKPPTEEESRQEMEEIMLLNDEDFEKKIIGEFTKIGYTLKG